MESLIILTICYGFSNPIKTERLINRTNITNRINVNIYKARRIRPSFLKKNTANFAYASEICLNRMIIKKISRNM